MFLYSNIKKYYILILYVICLGISFSQAYSISGVILDAETKIPISNTNIYIKESDFGTSSNKQGYFVLYLNSQLDNDADLIVKMIGYESQTIRLDLSKYKIDLGEIYLINKSLELKSIHVHSHEDESSQISDLSLSGQALSNNLASNVAMTLSNQPNIGVNSFGVATSKPVLRGYSGDRFLLIKDGSKMGDLSQSSIDHVITLDVTEVSDIEIIRGPKSLVYGPNVVGGVINTSLYGDSKIRVDKFLRQILLGGQSFNSEIYGNMMLFLPIKDNQISIFLSNRNAKNQTSPIGELDNTYSETFNYKLGFTRYYKNSYINFIIEDFNIDYGIPPSSGGHVNGVDIELTKKTFQINYHEDISFYSLNQFDLRYNFIDYGHKEFENLFSVGLSKNTHNFKIDFKSSDLIIGLELNYEQFLPNGFYWTPVTDEIDLSAYGFYEEEFNGFNLLNSFRLGYLAISPQESNGSFSNLDNEEVKRKDFKYLSTSLGVKRFFNRVEINAWFINTMRAPQIEELFSDGPHLGSYSYEIGEPNLELERIYGVESSARYKSIHFESSLTMFYNYSPYYYQMSKIGECQEEFVAGETHPCYGADFIEFGSGDGWLYKYKTEGVQSVIKGLEFNLNYNHKNFNIAYNFSLARGDDLTNELPLSYMNPDKQNVIINYKTKVMSYEFCFTKIHSQNRLGEFETFTPGTFLTDFIITHTYRKHSTTLQINNIFDEIHYNHLSRIKDLTPEPGASVHLIYKVIF